LFNTIRSALVPLTMPIAMIAALPLWLVSGSRQRAINFATGFWADMTCALIGLRVSISGQEFLLAPRPAMFMLNHQSNADGFLVAKLIRKDIAFLGKKELSKQAIRGRLMQFAGVVLVDRQNSAAAARAMQPLIDAIRKDKKSVAIFPEGTRSHSTTLGKFRKGSFLIAMRARVPIVPIVIHNAIDAQARGETAFRPTNIKVEVLAPIDTGSWKIRAIDEHILEVRQQFLQVLGQLENRA
jgi:putative phosphoserine phosphatase / 1-acylglycerol-3-phosphate O-acyltransferase